MAAVKTGDGFLLFGEALIAWSVGRLFGTTMGDYWGSSIGAMGFFLVILGGGLLWMAATAEDLVAEKLGMETWKLRSHLFVIGGGYVFGLAGSLTQWVAFTGYPMFEAWLQQR